jgi:uncharacterized protein related to proFAR isomerase
MIYRKFTLKFKGVIERSVQVNESSHRYLPLSFKYSQSDDTLRIVQNLNTSHVCVRTWNLAKVFNIHTPSNCVKDETKVKKLGVMPSGVRAAHGDLIASYAKKKLELWNVVTDTLEDHIAVDAPAVTVIALNEKAVVLQSGYLSGGSWRI